MHFSIDDFGTGYSSLAQLRSLPLHELKIDKSFVLNLTESQEDVLIVRSTIELAHNMGLVVCAEGVESEAAIDLLASLNCDIGTGVLASAGPCRRRLSRSGLPGTSRRWRRRASRSAPSAQHHCLHSVHEHPMLQLELDRPRQRQ